MVFKAVLSISIICFLISRILYHYWRYARCWWHLTLHIINVEKNISRLLFRCQYKFCDLWSSIICIDLKLQIQVSFTSHWIQTRSSDKPEVNVTLNSSAVLDPKQWKRQIWIPKHTEEQKTGMSEIFVNPSMVVPYWVIPMSDCVKSKGSVVYKLNFLVSV